ncbi:hypothetical protein SCYAM73S_01955 [Streptomyces cyaneofuscatus]
MLLNRLAAGPSRAARITHTEHLPPRPGRHARWPDRIRPEVLAAVRAAGIEHPWAHQARVAEHALDGDSVVVATGTASGKSLAYLAPVVDPRGRLRGSQRARRHRPRSGSHQGTGGRPVPGRRRNFHTPLAHLSGPRSTTATARRGTRVDPPVRNVRADQPGHAAPRHPALPSPLVVLPDVIKSSGDFAKDGWINVIPDKDQRMAEINADPIRWIAFMTIRNSVGEGHDQFVDDTYPTPRLAVPSPCPASPTSSPSTCRREPSTAPGVRLPRRRHGRLPRRHPRRGLRLDLEHRARPGHQRPATSSAPTRPATSPTRTSSPDGLLWTMSIGEVTPRSTPPGSTGPRATGKITVVDAPTYETVHAIDMRPRLDAFGRTDHSDAVRPPVFTPDETKLYFQVSFLNGFLEYDVATDRITRLEDFLPTRRPRRPHHLRQRLAPPRPLDQPRRHKLCVAGTMDDYATVVNRATLHGGPLVTGVQALLGHGERRRPVLRRLRERRRPGHRDRLRHREQAALEQANRWRRPSRP